MKLVLRIILFICSIVLTVLGSILAISGEENIVIIILIFVLALASLITAGFLKKKRIVFRIISVVFSIGLLLLGGVTTFLGYTENYQEISDVSTKIDIWGDTIPLNNTNSKLEVMNYNPKAHQFGATLKFTGAIMASDEFKDVEKEIDTMTFVNPIKGGYEKETFEDVPFLIPYMVGGASKSCIIVPGGGFAYKSIEGGDAEGKNIAIELNKEGINAFVLQYRSNPYVFPAPQLDLQRAVRYLKNHALDLKIDPTDINLIGFSAGGYNVGSYINKYIGKGILSTIGLDSGYVPDVVDLMPDSVHSAAMIYPALTFNYNQGMLFSCFDANDVRDETKRAELLVSTDLTNKENFNSKNIKQFVAYGTSDTAVGNKGPKEYINMVLNEGVELTEVVARDQNHCFDTSYYLSRYIKFIKS